MLKKIGYLFITILSLLTIGYGISRFFPSYKAPFIFTTVLTLVHFYVWSAIKPRLEKRSKPIQIVFRGLFFMPIYFIIAATVYEFFVPIVSWPPFIRIYLIGILFTVVVSLLIPVVFIFLADIIRFFQELKMFFSSKRKRTKKNAITRKKFLVNTGLAIGGVVLGSMGFGMLHGSYHFKTFRERLKIKNLPSSLKGLRIVQISDFHLGTWASKEPLIRAVEQINDLQPDLVFFTGDLVNNITEEAYPFFEELRALKAKHGIYSILGNHDYGKYHHWDTDEEEQENFDDLVAFYENLDWKLLRNEHSMLQLGNADLAIVGVENWSSHPRFPRKGDLDKALEGVSDQAVKILLSHDPTHWDSEVTKHSQHIDLTLSGHTHGFQVGIETPYFRWSPAQYMYKHWAGLYAENDKYLYVNRGIGAIGFPGRIGIRPEITLIELS